MGASKDYQERVRNFKSGKWHKPIASCKAMTVHGFVGACPICAGCNNKVVRKYRSKKHDCIVRYHKCYCCKSEFKTYECFIEDPEEKENGKHFLFHRRIGFVKKKDRRNYSKIYADYIKDYFKELQLTYHDVGIYIDRSEFYISSYLQKKSLSMDDVNYWKEIADGALKAKVERIQKMADEEGITYEEAESKFNKVRTGYKGNFVSAKEIYEGVKAREKGYVIENESDKTKEEKANSFEEFIGDIVKEDADD